MGQLLTLILADLFDPKGSSSGPKRYILHLLLVMGIALIINEVSRSG